MNWYNGENADFLAEVRSYLGVRWAHQGRSREGVDCVGLPIVCAQVTHGLAIPVPDYPRDSVDETMLAMCRAHLQPIDRRDMQPSDLVVIGFGAQRHMAVVADYVHGGLSLVHAYLPNRKVIEVRLDAVWLGRVLAAFRLPRRAG